MKTLPGEDCRYCPYDTLHSNACPPGRCRLIEVGPWHGDRPLTKRQNPPPTTKED